MIVMTKVIFAIWMLIIWVSVSGIVLREDLDGKEPNTIDVWKAAAWPFRLSYHGIKLIIFILNEIIMYTALMLGIEYRRTKVYKQISRLGDIDGF